MRKGIRLPQEADRGAWEVGALAASAIFFALSFLYFAPLWLPDRGPFGTDYLAATYIFHDFVRAHQLDLRFPSWLPHVFGGLPVFANPGSTFHPVFVLGNLFLSTERVMAFIFLVQFWLAGIGMFLFARELGSRSWIALLAGVAFQFTGITSSWIYAGHDGRIMVATMAPLLFFFLLRGIRTGSFAPFAGGAATLSMALLSFQIQNAYYLLIASGLWAIFLLHRFRRGRSLAQQGRMIGYGLLLIAAAFAIASVNFLPFLRYVPESPRGDPGGRGYEYSTSFSMPPADLLAIAVPEQSGASIYAVDPSTGRMTRPMFPAYTGPNPMKLHTEYLGALVLLMLLLAWRRGERDPILLFFTVLSLFMISLALGGHTPIYRLYYEIMPGLKRFRAPDLAFYVAAFSAVVITAITMEKIARDRDDAAGKGIDLQGRVLKAWAGLLVFAVIGGAIAASTEVASAGMPSRAGGWARFALFVALTGGILVAWVRRSMVTNVAAILLLVVTLGDLWVIGKRFQQTTPPTEALFMPDDLARFLRSTPQPVRVWNFPGAPYRGQDDAFLTHFGIDLAGGEHAAPLQRWNEYVGAGEGLIPRTWNNFIEFPAFLDAASVRYVVSQSELEAPWLEEVFRGNSGIVYENLNALPRTYLVPVAQRVGEEEALSAMSSPDWDPRRVAFVSPEADLPLPESGMIEGSAEVVGYGSDQVVVRVHTNRSAVLILADNMYPGWKAFIDGVEYPVFRANHTLRGMIVPAGEHEVSFVFRSTELRIGLVIYGVGWALLLGYGLIFGITALRSRRKVGVA